MFVQISIDGSQLTHDRIRGKGSHSRALQGLSLMRSVGICTTVSFTAHQGNYLDFPQVVESARQVGVSRVWTDRLVPLGRGSDLKTLTDTQTREFFEIVHDEMQLCSRHRGAIPTIVSMRRSLQFLMGGDLRYRCAAGRWLIAVLPDGTVYPCRRLPIEIGNVRTESLSTLLKKAEETVCLKSPCPSCEFGSTCAGGSRCIAFATFGNHSMPDPGCWIS